MNTAEQLLPVLKAAYDALEDINDDSESAAKIDGFLAAYHAAAVVAAKLDYDSLEESLNLDHIVCSAWEAKLANYDVHEIHPYSNGGGRILSASVALSILADLEQAAYKYEGNADGCGLLSPFPTLTILSFATHGFTKATDRHKAGKET